MLVTPKEAIIAFAVRRELRGRSRRALFDDSLP
jgi:hypothetical protein